MKKLFCASLLLIPSAFGFALNAATLKIFIDSNNDTAFQSRTYLIRHFIDQKKVVDSAYATNKVLFKLNDSLPKGLYNIMVYTSLKDAKGKYQRIGFDVIITGADIEFTIAISDSGTLGNVRAKAGDNFTYYEHFNKEILLKQKAAVVEMALAQYPAADDFYEQLKAKKKNIQQSQIDLWSAIDKSDSKLPVYYYLQLQKAANANSIRNINFGNPLLKNSSFIPALAWNYLEQGESITPYTELVKRIDTLLPALKTGDEAYNLMLAEMLTYYEKKGMTEVVVYLNEHYVMNDVCENTELTAKVKAKNETLKKTLPGQTAPDILLNGANGLQSLSNIKAGYTLVLFWESSCPHCQQLINELQPFYRLNHTNGFEILGVALDTSAIAYGNYVVANGIDWPAYVDFKGWQSKPVTDYGIIATPVMFLLNNEKKIIARPLTVNELKALML